MKEKEYPTFIKPGILMLKVARLFKAGQRNYGKCLRNEI